MPGPLTAFFRSRQKIKLIRFSIKYSTLPLLFLLCTCIYAQEPASPSAEYYKKAMAALTIKDTAKAEEMLKESVRENSTAPALYELAKIYTSKNTISGRDRARDLLTHAILKEPDNVKYRYLMATLMEKFSTSMSYDVYKNILGIDSTDVTALYNLGRIKEEDFNEYNNSVFQEGGEPSLSLEKFTKEDFKEAERYLKGAIKTDSLCRDAYLHLSYLYEDNGEPEKGIPLLRKLIKMNGEDADAYLYLGLLYYEDSKIDSSLKYFQNALILMKLDERIDFTYNSVKELLQPIFGDRFDSMTDMQITDLIDLFWKASDPLYLTKYNERLLEHYARVAYANLRFGLPKKKIPGWKTDRGETVLRYGRPLQRIRYRPHLNLSSSMQIMMKTDVWIYKDITLGFTDQFWSGNYQFSEPSAGSKFISQFPGDSHMFVNYLRKVRFENYDPKYNGPVFDVPFNILQFRDSSGGKSNFTDLYVSYALDAPDSLLAGGKYHYNHNLGVFFFDDYFNTIFDKRDSVPELSNNSIVPVLDDKKMIVNSVSIKAKPDSGHFALEIKRNSNGGIFSKHEKLRIENFGGDKLRLSDIVLASNISTSAANPLPLKRHGISLLPNPPGMFSKEEKPFVYFEIYNLKILENGSGEFEQQITVRKKDERSSLAKAFNSVLNIIGMGSEVKKLTMVNHYKTGTPDPQIYFQLDLDKYTPGDYYITAEITDKNSGKTVNRNVLLHWR